MVNLAASLQHKTPLQVLPATPLFIYSFCFMATMKAERTGLAGTRVRLPAEPSKSSSNGGMIRRLSRAASEADSNMVPNPSYEAVAKARTEWRYEVSTIMPHSNSSAQLSRHSEAPEFPEDSDLPSIVTHLENMQAQQRSPQQPNPHLDATILQLIGERPERRQRMAIMTKSALLRKKILTVVPLGGRAVGCAVLGATYEWRKAAQPDSYSDCNWPKAVHNHIGVHHLPGGGAQHDRLLRSPSDKRTHHPILQSSEFYSFPRAKRFPGTNANGELNPEEVQKRAVPGPGAYMKSVPGGTAFTVDGGETIILGANHTYPWKKAMGRQLNPIEADATTLESAPCYTFPKTRRTVADTFAGHGLKDGGPVKTDTGCLSPGFVYELHSTMRPMYGTRTLDGTQSCVRRKTRKRLGGEMKPKVRCYPMNVEAEVTQSDGA